ALEGKEIRERIGAAAVARAGTGDSRALEAETQPPIRAEVDDDVAIEHVAQRVESDRGVGGKHRSARAARRGQRQVDGAPGRPAIGLKVAPPGQAGDLVRSPGEDV